MQALPQHLQKYIVQQDDNKYTPIDQACWRYILRQLKNFLSQHAHSSYLDGLEKTGISTEEIPKISDISKKLEVFGWRALPVSGFIPPAAFMELQSLSVLPIASDMRTLAHLMYTPAPDIVHEAAGHAPILIHPEFAAYLKQYAQVAKKSIISREDFDVYKAIRVLSDIKENPDSTKKQIDEAQKKLDQVLKQVTHISEAAELSRMNWWTAEYGLIGPMNDPKIYGAGLLSSVGESRWCLSSQVKKIPLTVDCLKYSYDITEPQPQLFVAESFQALSQVLEEMASKMAFRVGGWSGLNKIIQAESVNTVELNSGLQISGQLVKAYKDEKTGSPAYLKFSGPSQLSTNEKQLSGHGKDYHTHGFGTPVGFFKAFPQQCPSTLSSVQLEQIGLVVNGTTKQTIKLEMSSGVEISGELFKITSSTGKNQLLSFKNCTVRGFGEILFEPSWGVFDMALGSQVTSVFGGPADRNSYGENEDFLAAQIPPRRFSNEELERHLFYQKNRDWRKKILNSRSTGAKMNETDISEFSSHLQTQLSFVQKHSEDWLLLIENLELLQFLEGSASPTMTKSAMPMKEKINSELKNISSQSKDMQTLIADGIQLADQLVI